MRCSMIERIETRFQDWDEDNVRTKVQSVCELMGKLLVANWPRNYSRCTQEQNTILYAVMNIVRGWLNALTDQVQLT